MGEEVRVGEERVGGVLGSGWRDGMSVVDILSSVSFLGSAYILGMCTLEVCSRRATAMHTRLDR